MPRIILLGLLCTATVLLSPRVPAQDAAAPQGIAGLDKALADAKEGTSEARQRLAVKRVVRDAEKLLEPLADSTAAPGSNSSSAPGSSSSRSMTMPDNARRCSIPAASS